MAKVRKRNVSETPTSARAIAARVNASETNANDALELLKTLRLRGTRDSGDVFDALVALERFFCERAARGELAERRRLESVDEASWTTEEAARVKYLRWLAKHHDVFVRRVTDVVVDGACEPRVRVLALAVIMEVARCETPGKFSNELYAKTMKRCACAKSWSGELLGSWAKRYASRVDVRYYTYMVMKRIAGELRDNSYEPSEEEAAAKDVARNVYDILNAMPRTFEDHRGEGVEEDEEEKRRKEFARMLAKLRGAEGAAGDEDEEEKEVGPWCEDADSSAVDLEAAKKRRRTSASAGAETTGRPKWTEGVRHRRAFSDAWLALLRAEFPEDIYRKILTRLHVDVMPHMVNPQLLSDFCVDSIDVGGLTGMLALNGLFVLMTQHGLEYPTFYNRLYQLLDQSSLHANHRRGFFSLMDVFLKSPALPAYLVASFVKRFGRLALHAPPAGIMVCVGFIHNLLRRHKSCVVLVHREPPEGEPAKLVERDPFDAEENDPAKTNALASSLWEIETLRAHYFPQVPKMVSLLERDLTDRVKTKELEMGDLCAANYGSLVREELDARVKKVALATRAEAFTSLFDAPEVRACFGDAFVA